MRPAATPGEIGGVALIEGEQVELLDPHWLFGSLVDGQAFDTVDGPPLVCALSEDGWMENILRPLIEAAGYRTVPLADAAAERADVVIIAAEAAVPPAAPAVLKLRAMPAPSGPGDDSIYRYDRESLLGALGERAAAIGKR